MSDAATVLRAELERWLIEEDHDAWTYAAVLLYAANGVEPDPNQIENMIRKAER